MRTQDIEVVRRCIRINSQILDKDKWRVPTFCLDGGVKGLAHLAKPRIYRSILVKENRMVRGNGSALAKNEVKATATPMTKRIRMRRRRLRDTLRKDLSTIPISAFLARDAQRNGTKQVGDQTFRALSSQLVIASTSNGFRSRHTAPLAAARDSRPGSASAVVMITGEREP
jgi:hypothetical protein